MPAVQVTIRLPADLWRGVQSLATHEGNANTVILRALEEYITATAKQKGRQSGKYHALVQALSTPVAHLRAMAEAAT